MAVLLVLAACSSSSDAAPLIDVLPETMAHLSAEAVAIACSPCGGPFLMRDQLLDSNTLAGDEEAMSQFTRAAVAERFPDVEFVDSEGAGLAMGPDGFAEVVVVSVSSPKAITNNGIAFEVGVSDAGEFLGRTVLFGWNGTEWERADPEDLGITVTTSVS